MKKVNGVLAEALKEEMLRQDLGVQQVAAIIHRSRTTVFTVLKGGKVSERTIKQIEIHFPLVFN